MFVTFYIIPAKYRDKINIFRITCFFIRKRRLFTSRFQNSFCIYNKITHLTKHDVDSSVIKLLN